MCSEITQELVDEYKMELLERLKPTTLNSYMFRISPTIKYGHRVGLIKEEIRITHVREQETVKAIVHRMRILHKLVENCKFIYNNITLIVDYNKYIRCCVS